MTHDDWDLPGFALYPLAPGTGPFPHRPFLETWWRHRALPDDRLLLIEGATTLLPLMVRDGVVQFLGEQDLTDYHSPLGVALDDAVAHLAAVVPAGTPFRFDSLPAEAAGPLREALEKTGIAVEAASDEVAAVLPLPGDYEEYLASLSKKERHETRRKGRRFTEAVGEPSLVRLTDDKAVPLFADMHRSSSGDKGAFMTDAMESLFAALNTGAGGHVDAVVGDSGEPVALGYGFEDEHGYYLYNSAFDPEHGDISPGVVLVSLLVERAIGEGRQVLDFLKGDEHYKFRLGAQPRELFTLTGVLGGGR